MTAAALPANDTKYTYPAQTAPAEATGDTLARATDTAGTSAGAERAAQKLREPSAPANASRSSGKVLAVAAAGFGLQAASMVLARGSFTPSYLGGRAWDVSLGCHFGYRIERSLRDPSSKTAQGGGFGDVLRTAAWAGGHVMHGMWPVFASVASRGAMTQRMFTTSLAAAAVAPLSLLAGCLLAETDTGAKLVDTTVATLDRFGTVTHTASIAAVVGVAMGLLVPSLAALGAACGVALLAVQLLFSVQEGLRASQPTRRTPSTLDAMDRAFDASFQSANTCALAALITP